MATNDIDKQLISNITAYLKTFNKGKKISNTEFRSACPYHNGNNELAFVLNTDTGIFHCFNCEEKGNYKQLAKHLKIIKEKEAEIDVSISNMILYCQKNLDKDKYRFEDRTIKDLQIGLDKSGNFHFRYFDYNGKYLTTKKKKIGGSFQIWEKKGLGNQLYLLDKVKYYDREKPLYICEGEPDAIMLYQLGLQAVGISGKNGYTEKLAGECNKYIGEFKEIIICLDKGNEKNNINIANRLSNKLVKSINWTVLENNIKLVNEYDIRDLLKEKEGKHLLDKLFSNLVIVKNDEEKIKKIKDNGFIIVDNMIEAINEMLKEYIFVRTDENKDSVYLVNASNIEKFYYNKNINPIVKDILDQFILKCKITTEKGFKDIKKNEFYSLLSKLIATREILPIKVDFNNLCVIRDNKIRLSTDIKNGVVITKNREVMEYNDIKPAYNNEVEKVFEAIYGVNVNKVKAHIITAILNEDMSSKHLLFITGSAQVGKSKTAELISKTICKEASTISLNSLGKILSKFFATRSPVFDNIDNTGKIDYTIIDKLGTIITSEKFTDDQRYSESGITFNCDVYPIITSTDNTFLDRASLQAFKSRCIIIENHYNEFSKDNIDKLRRDENFIEKARLHFYYLAEKYLDEKDTIDISMIDNRCKNFFKVLYWIDKEYAIKLDKELKYEKEYEQIIKDMIVYIDVQNEETVKFQVGGLLKRLKETYENLYDEYTPQKFGRKIQTAMVSDHIGKYLIKKDSNNKGNTIEFINTQYQKDIIGYEDAIKEAEEILGEYNDND